MRNKRNTTLKSLAIGCISMIAAGICVLGAGTATVENVVGNAAMNSAAGVISPIKGLGDGLSDLDLTGTTQGLQSNSFNVGNYTLYDIADNVGYVLNNNNKVTTLSSGHTRLGTLKVSGNVAKKNYNGVEAYAVYGDKISF